MKRFFRKPKTLFEYFLFIILPKSLIIFVFIGLLLWLSPSKRENPEYCITNVLAWMLTSPN